MGTVMPGDSANKDARERIARKGGKARTEFHSRNESTS
jgi:hypothetical protein